MRALRVINAVSLIILMSACNSGLEYKPHRVESSEQVGEVHLAATFVAPWEDFASRLSPQFDIDGAKALAAVLPRTSVADEQSKSQIAASLQLAPPTSSSTLTKTTNTDTEGVSKTTSEEKDEKAPGKIEEVPKVNVGDTNLTSTIKAPEKPAIGFEPMLQYSAANALYQEVQLLNSYVKNAARAHKATPYIVRVQLTVAPFAKFQPYDTHVLLSFFGDKGKSKEEGPYVVSVVPLLVTDSLETELSARSAQFARQLSAAATIMSGGFAAALGLDSRFEKLNAILASDFNSIFTVGRVSSNTLRVRIGAMRSSISEYAMVPRNYNFTLLALVHNNKPHEPARRMTISASFEYRDAKSGSLMTSIDRNELDEKIKEIIYRHQITRIPIDDDEFSDLKTSIFVGDGRWTTDVLRGGGSRNRPGMNISTDKIGEVTHDILKVLGSSGRTGARIDLPKPRQPALPTEQTVLLVDNGTNRSAVRLIGGEALLGEDISAQIEIPRAEGKPYVIPSVAIDVPPGGRNPVLTFPSLHAWKVATKDGDGQARQLGQANLLLTWNNRGGYDTNFTAPSDRNYGPILHIVQLPQSEAPTFVRIGRSISTIGATNKKGNFDLYVEFLDKGEAGRADAVAIAIDGAEIESVTTAAGDDIPSMQGKFTVTTDATLTIQLKNLNKGDDVHVSAITSYKGQEKGAPPPAILLNVN